MDTMDISVCVGNVAKRETTKSYLRTVAHKLAVQQYVQHATRADNPTRATGVPLPDVACIIGVEAADCQKCRMEKCPTHLFAISLFNLHICNSPVSVCVAVPHR